MKDHAPADTLYFGYESWKGWTDPFTYTKEEAAYFSGEMRGLQVRKADILEIGFGSGNFLAWARDAGARVAGTEINPAALSAGRAEKIELLDAGIERIADNHAGRFDTVVSFDVFEHFSHEEIQRRLKAVDTMLKNGGHLVLRFPNAQSPFGLAPQYGDPTHRSGLSRSAIEQLSQGTGLDVVRYGHAYRVFHASVSVRAARLLRAVLREIVGRVLGFVYATDIPWDPVVVLVMRKRQ